MYVFVFPAASLSWPRSQTRSTVSRERARPPPSPPPAVAVSPDVAPFATAVLDTQLGDLIRDVDPSELGLFSLVVPHSEQDARGDIPKLARSGFPGATPLKPTTRREVDPEVYAHAALKYIDR